MGSKGSAPLFLSPSIEGTSHSKKNKPPKWFRNLTRRSMDGKHGIAIAVA